ncbi:ATP synthase F1 subunit delta [Labilibacter sediminis]|nr:ATP synthase F1 subunit delta [Labilibacter sediminis]
MDNSLISVRYAKALFLLSKEKGVVDMVFNDMCMLADQCKNVDDFSEMLASPVITPSKKKKMLKSIFEKHVHKLTMNFLGIMVDNKRDTLLSSISRNFIDFYKEEQGLKTVTLYTAFELDDEYINNLKPILEKELDAKIELIVRVRDHLIGGFILMVDGKMIDASVANKLKKLKHRLLS